MTGRGFERAWLTAWAALVLFHGTFPELLVIYHLFGDPAQKIR